jgi:hypothetical protein
MKKVLLSAALLVAVCISANAQFALGIKGGANFSSINSDNLKSSTVAGYQAGLFARFGGTFFLQPELYVSSTGGNFNSNDNAYSAKVKFTNLNVPVLLGAKFGPKDLDIRIMAGPIYTSVLSNDFSSSINSAYTDFGHYNHSTLGYQAGAGIDLGAFSADLRYEGGLTDINPDFGQRQQLWAVSVGFRFF